MKVDLIEKVLFFESEQGWTSKPSSLPRQIFDNTAPAGSGRNKAEAYEELAKQMANNYIKDWSD